MEPPFDVVAATPNTRPKIETAPSSMPKTMSAAEARNERFSREIGRSRSMEPPLESRLGASRATSPLAANPAMFSPAGRSWRLA